MPALGLLTLLALGTAIGAVGIVLTMLVTNPAAIGPLGVTLWFVVVFAVMASSLSLVLYGIKTYFHVHATRQQRLRYSLRQGTLVAGWISGMLALGSLGGLGWRDVILLGLAAVIIESYVRFRWP